MQMYGSKKQEGEQTSDRKKTKGSLGERLDRP